MGHRNDYGLITAPILAGVERLWAARNLLINGIEVEPSFWFDETGLDDTAKTWTCRQTGTVLTETGSGASPDLAVHAPHPGDRAASADGPASGKSLIAASSAFGDISTEDMLVVCVLQPPVYLAFAMDKQAGPTDGWGVFDGGTSIALRLKTGGALTDIGANYVASAWGVFIAGVNRDEASANGACAFWNAVAGTGVDASARSGSLSNASAMMFLDRISASAQWWGNVALLAMYKRASWFSAGASGAAEMLAAAKELTALYLGHQALHNHDSLTPSTLPARTSIAYQERPLLEESGDPVRLFSMDANAGRVSHRYDSTTGLWLPGVVLEPAQTNRVLQSENYGNASWTKTGTCTVSTDAVAGPQNGGLADRINNVGGYPANSMHQNVTGFGASAALAVAIWFKRVSTTGTLRIWNYAGVGQWDLNMADLPDAWVELTPGSPYVSEAAAWSATAGGSGGFIFSTVSGKVSFDLWNSNQCEQAGRLPTSPIVTAAGAVTRTADGSVIYDNTYLTGEATVLFPVLISEHAPADTVDLVQLRNAAATDVWSIGTKQTTGVLRVTLKKDGGGTDVLEHTTNIADGKLHWIGSSVRDGGELVAWVDGVAVRSTHSGFDGAGSDELWLVSSLVGPWIGGVHVWPKFMTRMPRPIQPQLLTP